MAPAKQLWEFFAIILYETTLKSEPQNIEYRTAEFRREVSLRSIYI